MIEVINETGYILAFDGRVIESFTPNGNMRIHIQHVESVDVAENKKGKLWIKVEAGNQMGNLPEIDPEHRPLVDEFVTQVKAARGL